MQVGVMGPSDKASQLQAGDGGQRWEWEHLPNTAHSTCFPGGARAVGSSC